MYKKLKGKIKEVFDTQQAFADAMKMDKSVLYQRLKGNVEWKVSEMAKACDLLKIPYTEMHLYFIDPKSLETETL